MDPRRARHQHSPQLNRPEMPEPAKHPLAQRVEAGSPDRPVRLNLLLEPAHPFRVAVEPREIRLSDFPLELLAVERGFADV
jgi:hypothetical protein